MQDEHIFKVGDKVKVVELISRDTEHGVVLGDIYEVVSCDLGKIYIHIDGMTKPRLMYPSQLELHTEPVKLTPRQYMLDYHGIKFGEWFTMFRNDIPCKVGKVKFDTKFGMEFMENSNGRRVILDALYSDDVRVENVTKSKKELAIEQAEFKLLDAQDKIVTAEDEFLKAKYDLMKARNM